MNLLDIESNIVKLEDACEKARIITEDFREEFFNWNEKTENGQNYILHYYQIAKIKNDMALDYLTMIKKHIDEIYSQIYSEIYSQKSEAEKLAKYNDLHKSDITKQYEQSERS